MTILFWVLSCDCVVHMQIQLVSVLPYWHIGNERLTPVLVLIPNTGIGAFKQPNHCIFPLGWMCLCWLNMGLTRGHVCWEKKHLQANNLHGSLNWWASRQSGTNGRRAKFTPSTIGTRRRSVWGGLAACILSTQRPSPNHPPPSLRAAQWHFGALQKATQSQISFL